MIILGGHLIDKNTIYTPMGFPGLWNDAQLEGLANVARAVKRHGCALSVQLLHLGLRSPTPFLKTDPARDPYEYDPYMLAPSQLPAGEIPGGPTPKELEEHEIEYILQCFEDAAKRAISAGLDGVEFHIAHGYLPWQFLSPFYNHRKDRWGGSYENRLRFSIEAMRRIRKRIGDRPFVGYRINSTSFWEGDLLRERFGRSSPLLDSYPDDVRGRVGTRIHPRHQIRVHETRSPGRARKPSGGCGGACRLRRCGRCLACPADDRRRTVDDKGQGRARRRHSPLCSGQLLLAGGDPRQSRSVRL
jgi:2,4-dienoyl-CoA reductase-like NADH-dependent reductase (Old Yellow Enzyme family)